MFVYFLLAIVFFSSIGIWLPMISDDYTKGKMAEETFNAVAGNILTYSLAIFLVSSIDRIIYLFYKASKYTNNVLEFLLIICVVIITGYFVFLTQKSIKYAYYQNAIGYASYIVFIAWISWFYVKIKGSKDNNYATIGGVI